MSFESSISLATKTRVCSFSRNDDCVEGGESVLLDLLPVVEEMRRKFPQHFTTLTRVPATFERILPKRYVMKFSSLYVWQKWLPHVTCMINSKFCPRCGHKPAHGGQSHDKYIFSTVSRLSSNSFGCFSSVPSLVTC